MFQSPIKYVALSLFFLGYLFLGFTVTMGCMYTAGAQRLWIIAFAVFFLLIFWLTNKLVLVKKDIEKSNKNKNKSNEIFLIVFYVICAVVLFFPVNHFANVEFDQKESIKNKLKLKIELYTGMQKAFNDSVSDRIITFETSVKDALDQYTDIDVQKKNKGRIELEKLLNREFSDTKSVKESMQLMSKDITSRYTPSELLSKSNKYVKEANDVIKNGGFNRIISFTVNIDSEIDSLKQGLQKKLPYFKYRQNTNKIVLPRLFESITTVPFNIMVYVIITNALLHFLILVPYFFTERPKSGITGPQWDNDPFNVLNNNQSQNS
jgi:hypothetical protein